MTSCFCESWSLKLLLFVIGFICLFHDALSLSPSSITSGPFNKTIIYEPNSLGSQSSEFSCTVAGNPTPTVLWLHGTDTITTDGQNYTVSTVENTMKLVVLNVTLQDGGQYTCIAQNNQSSVNASAYLTVLVSPQITQHPSSTTTREGDNILLTCNADGTPTPSLSWEKDETAISTGSRISLKNSNQNLEITNVTRSDAGNYQCTATNDASSVTSNVATLTVQYIDAPVISSNVSKRVPENDYLVLNCNASAIPSVTGYMWYKDGKELTSETSSLLLLSPVKREDAANYICQATNAVGEKNSTSFSVIVSYLDTPSLAANATFPVMENDYVYVQLTCTGGSSLSYSYTWFKNGQQIPSSSSSTILLNPITRNDVGTYICQTSNAAGKKNSSGVTVGVNFLDTPLLTTNATLPVRENTTFNIQCKINGSKPANYTWFKNGEALSTSKNSPLSFTVVKRAASGNYTCKATNAAGTKESAVTEVVVQYIDRPTLNVSSTNFRLREGEQSLFIKCSAKGIPTPNYQWKKSGKVFLNSRILVLSPANRSHFGDFYCEASNAAGTSKSYIFVNVEYLDKPVITPTSIVVNESKAVTLKCSTKGGDTQPTFTWRKKDGTFVKHGNTLTFSSIKRKDSGSYTCEATNVFGNKSSDPANITVNYIDKPFVTPKTTLPAKENTSVVLTCAVNGSVPVSYSWLRNTKYIPQAISSTLNITAIKRADAGQYVCQTWNGFGIKTSEIVNVSVLYLDTPTANNTQSPFFAVEGNDLILRCSATATGSPTYKWIANFTKVVSASDILMLPSFKRNQAGSYICSATNDFGTKNSSIITISAYYLNKPTVKGTPEGIIDQGDSVTLTCSAVGVPNVISYTWFKDNVPVSREGTFTRSQLKKEDAGSYYCVASNKAGNRTADPLNVTVTFVDKPTISQALQQTLNETEKLVLTCSANSLPKANYEWIRAFHSDMTIDGATKGSGETFTIDRINRTDAGSYICDAGIGDRISKQSAFVNVTVNYLDIPVIAPSGTPKVSEGQKLSLSCSVSSHPEAVFTWFNSTNLVGNGKTLTLNSVLRARAGRYTCKAKNVFGEKTSAPSQVIVKYRPSITITANADYLPRVILGNTLMLNCSADGVPEASLTWKKGETTLEDGKGVLVYTIQQLTRSNSGNYTCIARNSEGEDIKSQLVIVGEPPDPPTNVRNNTVESRWVVIRWNRPKFNGNSPITNYTVEVSTNNNTWKVASCENGSPECTVPESTPTAKIIGLIPFTNYYFRVRAANNDGRGNPSDVLGPVTTDEEAPTAARNLGTTVMNSTAILVHWLAPAMPNGRVGYRIQMREFEPFRNGYQDIYKGSSVYFLKTGLEEFTTYEFIVHAYNIKYDLKGPSSNSTKNKTDAAKPSGPPRNVTVAVLAPTLIRVSWTLPPIRDQNGIIRAYTLKYNVTLKHFSESRTTNNTTSFVLSGLNESEIYQIQVRAENIKGSGPYSSPVFAETLESVPSPPTNIKVTNDSSVSGFRLVVTWDVPRDPNGVITGYRLFYHQLTTDGAVGQEIVMNFSSSVKRHITEKLDPYSTYNISMSARTSVGYGARSQPEVVLTREGTPTKVRNVRVISEPASNYVTLAWDPPTNIYGVLIGYEVTISKPTSPNVKGCMDKQTTCKVEGLKPFTEYTFSIVARNSAAKSDAATKQHKTESAEPPTFPPSTVFTASGKTAKTVNVKLTKFDDSNGIVHTYQVIVIKLTNQSKPSTDPNKIEASSLKDKDTADQNSIPYYVAAQFTANKFTQSEFTFVVGNGERYPQAQIRSRRAVGPEYINSPLSPNTYYSLFYRGYVSANKHTSSPWFDPVKTKAETKTSETGLATGAIVGIVVGIIAIIAIVIVVIGFMKRRQDSGEHVSSPRRKPSGFKKRFPSFRPKPPPDPRAPVDLENFEDHVSQLKANGSFGFSQEYAMISRELINDYSISALPYNNMKNRYANVPAYDHSRVELLQIDSTPGCDYVNANYIEGFSGPREYIATQGPLPETLADFWRMIWEQNVHVIVMLTRVEERGRDKCAQYWPDQGSIPFKDLIITLMEVQEFPDLIIRTLHLTRTGQPMERVVKQFHYISWPDHGVPDDPCGLLSLIRKVNNSRQASGHANAPLVVHCSAGVGRTGTYIVLDTQMQKIKRDKKVSIFTNVSDIRDQRCLMVQTEDQFIFLHQALLEFIDSGNTEIIAGDLRDYIKKQSQVDVKTGITGLMDEFIRLAKADTGHKFQEANRQCNQNKNRYKNVYPYDETRVRLTQKPGADGSDYINANFIDGYITKQAFIATQAPLPNTIPDFWRMIWEQACHTIVMLSNEQESGKLKVHKYWPSEGSIKVSYFIIELLKVNSYAEYLVREFKLTNSEEGRSRVILQYQYTAWPENGSPDSGFGMIDLIGQVSKWNASIGNKTITVHCRYCQILGDDRQKSKGVVVLHGNYTLGSINAGVGRTGVFIALTNLIERLKTEAVVDVFQSVRRLRQQRTAMVQTRDQYEFCYRALQEYLESFDHYSNFR